MTSFLLGSWYIFTWEERMKQDCMLFTFSKGTFSHTEIQWCMYNFIWQQCQKQNCMDVNSGHSVFIPFPLLPTSIITVMDSGRSALLETTLYVWSVSFLLSLYPLSPHPQANFFFNLIFWIGNTFTCFKH